MHFPGKLLIVTDNSARRRAFDALLHDVQATALRADSPEQAHGIMAGHDISATFLDADDANITAAGLCEDLRRRFPPASCALILFGSGLEAAALVRWLDSGADDYWKYPFNIPVCRAYLRAILRRITRVRPSGGPLSCGDLGLDPGRRQALLNGKVLPLRSKEFDLLSLLLARREDALSRDVLMNAVWGTDYFGTTRTIDFHISQLRRKLGAYGRHIETVPGIGYRFAAKGPRLLR